MKYPRFLKPGWLMLYVLVVWFLITKVVTAPTYDITDTFRLEEGASLGGIYAFVDAGRWDTLQLKRYIKKQHEAMSNVQPGSYVFSGTYSPGELVEVFAAGPQQVYEHLTVLEGWNIYDVDTYLSKAGLIETGAYISFVTDIEILGRYRQRYPFLEQAFIERNSLNSLEGYLYPDTYFVDPDKDIIDQLVYLQLEGFAAKVWGPYGEQLLSLSSSLQGKGYAFKLSSYGALILASIIEKEEGYGPNRPTIASVFYNRLDTNMRIDADISLCYGLQQGFESCTPEVIVEHLYDKSNPYNTRAVFGLTPTPIVSPSASSVSSLLEATKSADFFYLHDSEGNLHTAKDQAGHVANKNRYLR